MFFKKKTFKFRANPYAEFNIAYTKIRRGFWSGFNFSKKNLQKHWPEISTFLAVLILGWALLQSSRLAAIGLNMKEKIISGGKNGAEMLKQAKTSLEKKDLKSAGLELDQAFSDFKQSQEDLSALRKNFLGLSALLPQQRTAEKIIGASLSLAEAGQSGVVLARLTSSLTFGPQGLGSESNMEEIYGQLEVFASKLQKASLELDGIDPGDLPESEREDFQKNAEKVKNGAQAATTLKSLAQLGRTFFSGKKTILLLFQNNNEIRPTGGFMGSFGTMELSDGKIESLKVSSIYDLDGQLIEKIVPPSPLMAVNDRWFMRDSNWFGSFPESAALITSFFEKEGGETPDLVLAVTPECIKKIVAITGPLTGPDGTRLDNENLQEKIQLLTSSSPADPSNEPKKILGQLLTQLMQKVGELDKAGSAKALKAVSESFLSKDLQIYSRIPEAESIFSEFNWNGEILDSERDYLLMSFANLGGTKTDLSISRAARLESTITSNGEIKNSLSIDLKNLMPSLPSANNKSFLRIYVPKGSRLISAEGFDKLNLPEPEKEGYKTNSAVYNWEKSSSKNMVTGTVIGEESNKTIFANWIELKAGESRRIEITYVLPFKVKKLDRMSLLIQKQPGINWSEFDYGLNAQGRKMLWSTTELVSTTEDSWRLKTQLNKDNFFGMVLMQE